MFFYIIVAFIATVCCYIGFSYYDKNKPIAYFFIAIFILFPSIIEGCRDMNIGTDMSVYGQVYFFNAMSYNSLPSFIKSLNTKEYAYHLLNYICSRTGSINVMLFAAALIKMTLLALTCVRFRKITTPWLVIFCYMMFLYWYGFSLMRQSLALSVSLFSLTYLYNKKYISFVICGLISYLFHSSGIFTFILPLVFIMSENRKRMAISILAVLVIYAMASTLFVFIADSGLFGDQMLDRYTNSGVASAKSNIVIMVVYILCTFFFKSNNKNLKRTVLSCSIFGLMILFLSSLFEVAFRLSFYFMMPLFILVPALIKDDHNVIKRSIGQTGLVIMFLAHYLISASHGLADTIPYHSIILESFI